MKKCDKCGIVLNIDNTHIVSNQYGKYNSKICKLCRSKLSKIPCSQSAKDKLSKHFKGRIFSEEHRKNMSLAFSGEKNGMFGKKHKTSSKLLIGQKSKDNWKVFAYRKNFLDKKIEYYKHNKAWSFNLTKETNNSLLNVSKILKGRVSTFKGCKHSITSRKILCEKRLLFYKNGGTTWNFNLTKYTSKTLKEAGKKIRIKILDRINNNKIHTHYKYKDINMRSSWEVKVAKWLDDNNIKWKYESSECRFELSNDRTYVIDFYLPELDKYIEVKGWWDEYSKIKYNEAIKKLNLCIIDKRNINNIHLNLYEVPANEN